MRRPLRAFVTLGVASALLVIGCWPADSSALAGGIGGQPGMPRDDEPRSRSIFVHTIKQGEKANDRIRVANNTEKTQKIALYAVDAITTNTGSFTCKQRSEPVDAAGRWIRLAKGEITLDKGKSELVDLSFTVPSGADVGEHNACIALEMVDGEVSQSGNLRIRTRSAIRAAITIPGRLHRTLAITSYGVAQNSDSQSYMLSVKNEGNVSADTRVQVQLKTLYGMTAYENGGEYPVLAGKTIDLMYKNETLPFFGGWYYAEATAVYDKKAGSYGVRDNNELVTLTAERKVVFIAPQPGALLLSAAGGVLIIGWRIAIWRSRRQVDGWCVYVVRPDDDLQKLAKHHGVAWRKLAKANKLRAPYSLQSGQQLRVPSQSQAETDGQ